MSQDKDTPETPSQARLRSRLALDQRRRQRRLAFWISVVSSPLAGLALFLCIDGLQHHGLSHLPLSRALFHGALVAVALGFVIPFAASFQSQSRWVTSTFVAAFLMIMSISLSALAWSHF